MRLSCAAFSARGEVVKNVAILSEVKMALRVSNSLTDDELQSLIDAAKADIAAAGADQTLLDDTAPLVRQAIIWYCKMAYGLDNADFERYEKSYEKLRDRIALSVKFGGAS